MMSEATPEPIIRNAVLDDIEAIRALCRRAYPGITPFSVGQAKGQIENFPSGQFVAQRGADLVGYSACFRIAEALAFAAHSWFEITGGGTAGRNDPEGDWLYGMETCVDPAVRGQHIGRCLYDARKALCTRLGLKGIVIGGRLEGLARRRDEYRYVDAYLRAVARGALRDETLSFQLGNGFEVVGVITGYLPFDPASLGYAALMVWRNPAFKA